jgi:hypothetical protein
MPIALKNRKEPGSAAVYSSLESEIGHVAVEEHQSLTSPQLLIRSTNYGSITNHDANSSDHTANFREVAFDVVVDSGVKIVSNTVPSRKQEQPNRKRSTEIIVGSKHAGSRQPNHRPHMARHSSITTTTVTGSNISSHLRHLAPEHLCSS